jgi:UDP-glucose 4-epimerase
LDYSKILVTGGAGFIGSHLVNRLMAEGYDVVVLDSFCTGRIENVKRHLESNRFHLVRGDVRDERVVKAVMDGVDAVVHLAALISVENSVGKPTETHDVNVRGTLNLLEESVRKGVKRFVYSSSAAVYGDENPLPLKEDHPLRPLSPYGVSKASAERYCLAFQRNGRLKTTVLRFFNVYGSRQGGSGVVARFMGDALGGRYLTIQGDGWQTRDFIHVLDVVEMVVSVMGCDEAVGEVLNCGTGRETSINELARTIIAISGMDLKLEYVEARHGDLRRSRADIRKAEKLIGYKPKISLEEGLREPFQSLVCSACRCDVVDGAVMIKSSGFKQ